MHGVERHREVLKPSQLRQAPTKRNYIPTDQGREMKPLSSKPLQGLGSTARLHNTTYEARASTTCDIRPWPVTLGKTSQDCVLRAYQDATAVRKRDTERTLII